MQEPDDAQAPLMVEAALKRSPVDFVLPLDQIARLLDTLDHGRRRSDAAAVGQVPAGRRSRGEPPGADGAAQPRRRRRCCRRDPGVEALELLLAHDVALAIIDVQMPGMDGFELAELMRGSERTRHVPIILVTAGVRDQHRLFKGYDTGAVDFLYKPIEPHILAQQGARCSSSCTGRSSSWCRS